MVERELVPSRAKAQALIMAGEVVVADHVATKPGFQVAPDVAIRIKGGARFVSRGGDKLHGALDAFASLVVRDRVAMDVGASTGGFTDRLLQAGCARLYAVDVGYGQLAWSIARDPRVIVLDRQNIRTMETALVPDPIELFVVDCSFISLTKVLPELPRFAAPQADVVALIKPQFEVGRAAVGKGGIVRDDTAREGAITGVVAHAESLGFALIDRSPSVVHGRGGNREEFVWLRYSAAA
jgi:23S rRNA (cytidine1920-2'-O)/16S rRNA (cytidine1409-2'-O)-methyltransferase